MLSYTFRYPLLREVDTFRFTTDVLLEDTALSMGTGLPEEALVDLEWYFKSDPAVCQSLAASTA